MSRSLVEGMKISSVGNDPCGCGWVSGSGWPCSLIKLALSQAWTLRVIDPLCGSQCWRAKPLERIRKTLCETFNPVLGFSCIKEPFPCSPVTKWRDDILGFDFWSQGCCILVRTVHLRNYSCARVWLKAHCCIIGEDNVILQNQSGDKIFVFHYSATRKRESMQENVWLFCKKDHPSCELSNIRRLDHCFSGIRAKRTDGGLFQLC